MLYPMEMMKKPMRLPKNICGITLAQQFASVSFKGPGFDQIRLAAATIVLVHHSRFVEGVDIRLDPLFNLSKGYIHFGFLAVAIFFAISGFLVTPSLVRSGDIIDFAANRFARIFPALIVVVFITMFFLGPVLTEYSLETYFSSPQFYRYAKNITTLLSNFLPGVVFSDGRPAVINTALWTLHFEVLCYATLAFMSLLGVLQRRRIFLFLFLISYALNMAMWCYPEVSDILPERLLTFTSFFVYFAAGASLFLYSDRIPYSPALAAILVIFALLCMPLGLGVCILPCCVPYLVIVLGLSKLPGRMLLKRDLSYGVYLCHAPIIVALMIFFPSLHVWWLVACIVFLITLLFAYLSWTLSKGQS